MASVTQEADDQQYSVSVLERRIDESLRKGNLPLAEILSRVSLTKDPANPKTYNSLGLIARLVNLPQFATQYFREAARLAPDWNIPKENLDKLQREFDQDRNRSENDIRQSAGAAAAERYLLIKAWGVGFWSDVSHVLGQLLVAELSGRIPVVHWGPNSLFGDGSGANAFELYFERVSSVTASDIQRDEFSVWPPKWDHLNLMDGEKNKWGGPFARVSGLYLLNRPENVVVSDFHTGVIELKPWIPAGHHLYGLSVDELYRYLARRYLRPTKAIEEEVERFYAKHLASQDFIAVHVRGSDKVIEMPDLDEWNDRYPDRIDRALSDHGCDRIFLMTDDSRILDRFVRTYGDKIVATDCLRTGGKQGIHYHQGLDRRRLGTEVMMDTYIALRAKAFIGNACSNPSLMVACLKDWSQGHLDLVGRNIFNTYNVYLHKW